MISENDVMAGLMLLCVALALITPYATELSVMYLSIVVWRISAND